ncbi:MAG: sigma-70 family RNA polymerase sigma factor [Chloroflexi bacterium]|nr:sigma-70 family RNA polymerase sigma factor [Chloroflexota bacterium]
MVLSESLLSEDLNLAYSTDPDLVQACLKGNETAWKTLVERYGQLVYSIPRRYGFSPVEADQVFQKVFTILLRQLSTLRDQTHLVGWLVTITHHETRQVARRKPVSIQLSESIEKSETYLIEQVDFWERQRLVTQALGQLEAPCVELLTALFLEPEKLSSEKIATRLGAVVGSIGPARARCFKKLETLLIAMDGDFHFWDQDKNGIDE